MNDNPPIEAEELIDDGFAFTMEEIRKEPQGLILQRAKILFGQAPLEFPRYQATVRAVVGQDMKTGQTVVATGQIPIPATSLEDAFRKLPELIKKAGEELKKAARKPKIVLPDSVKNPDPNGDGSSLRFDPNA